MFVVAVFDVDADADVVFDDDYDGDDVVVGVGVAADDVVVAACFSLSR